MWKSDSEHLLNANNLLVGREKAASDWLKGSLIFPGRGVDGERLECTSIRIPLFSLEAKKGVYGYFWSSGRFNFCSSVMSSRRSAGYLQSSYEITQLGF